MLAGQAAKPPPPPPPRAGPLTAPAARAGSGCARSRGPRPARRRPPSPPRGRASPPRPAAAGTAWRCRGRARGPGRPPRRRCPSGSTSGSSPWTLITISASVPRAASASRSVPVAWSREVITTSPPNPRTTAAMRSSSVATSTRSGRRARRTRSCTCWIMGFPCMSERGFPGRRVDPKRAGMIATMAKSIRGPRVRGIVAAARPKVNAATPEAWIAPRDLDAMAGRGIAWAPLEGGIDGGRRPASRARAGPGDSPGHPVPDPGPRLPARRRRPAPCRQGGVREGMVRDPGAARGHAHGQPPGMARSPGRRAPPHRVGQPTPWWCSRWWRCSRSSRCPPSCSCGGRRRGP